MLNQNNECADLFLLNGDVRFGPKVGRIGSNGTNPGLFQIIIQYILYHNIVQLSQNVLKSDLKNSWICPICG